MSRRRDMTPTIERKDGQIETMGKTLVKAQETERRLKTQLREKQSLVSELSNMHRVLSGERDHSDRLRAECACLQQALDRAPRPLWHRVRDWFESLCQ